MRIRTIKPDYWTHRMHKRLSVSASLLGAGLICMADDEGRFEADEQTILSTIFPRRPLDRPIPEVLQELVAVDFLVLYKAVLDKQEVLLGVLPGFVNHQRIQKARASRLPGPEKQALPDYYNSLAGRVTEESHKGNGAVSDEYDTGKNMQNGTVFRQGNLDENTSQRLIGRKGRERNGGDEASPALADSEGDYPEAEIPSLAEVLAFCDGPAGIPKETGAKFHHYYEKIALPKWTKRGGGRFQWRGELVAWHARDQAEPGRNGHGRLTGPGPGPDKAQLMAELEQERDPVKRAELRKRLEAA